MGALIRSAAIAFCLLFLAGCGATVGDSCTTVSECGNQLCINQSYTPGGYCSKQCTLGEDSTCPGGSVCVRDGAAKDLAACFKVCKVKEDCRSGYVCASLRSSTQTVCVGPGA